MIDISGQEVINRTVSDREIEINVNNLKPGVYFIKVQTAEGVVTKQVQVAR